MSRPQVIVDGQWLSSIGWWGDLELVDRWPGGSWSADWSMNLAPGEQPPALRAGAPVRVMHGPVLLWAGSLTDPDWDSGTFHADGRCFDAQAVQAVALDGTPTVNPGAALLAAWARGALDWTSGDVTWTDVTDDAPTTLNSLSDLLDVWCEQNGMRWAVSANGRLLVAADPTTPTFHVLPGVEPLGVSTERAATHVLAQYITPDLKFDVVQVVSSSWQTGDARIEKSLDLTDQGTMTTAKAQAWADNVIARVDQARFTNGFEVGVGQVVDGRGSAVGLSALQAGALYRVHGMRDPRGGLAYTDVVVGEVARRFTEGRAQLNPVDLVAADFEAIVEELRAEEAA